jgi:hypothetical protein
MSGLVVRWGIPIALLVAGCGGGNASHSDASAGVGGTG